MEAHGRAPSEAEICLADAREAYNRGALDVARESLARGVRALNEQPSLGNWRALRVALFFATGNVHLRQGAFIDALLAYGIASAAAKALGDRLRALRIDLWIGEAHRRAGRDIDAEVRWRELVRNADDAGLAAEPLRVEAFRRLGNHLESRGRTFEAARIRKLVGLPTGPAEPPFD